MELWDLVKDKDWALTAPDNLHGSWEGRLWNIDRHYQTNGTSGAYGQGYGASSAVGAALAHREHGRLPICITGDGDTMYVPGVHWTAAHHRIPLLSIVHNNRSYHQEVMHVQKMAANWRQRGADQRCRARQYPSTIRPSILPVSRKVWGSSRLGRSRVRTNSGRRLREPSTSSSRASLPWSM